MLLRDRATQLSSRKDYRASLNFIFAAMKYAELDARAALDREARHMFQAIPEQFRSAQP